MVSGGTSNYMPSIDPPGYEVSGARVEAYWKHPTQGVWVLYMYDDSESGERLYFEFHPDKGVHKQHTTVDSFYRRVRLLERNRAAYNSACGGMGF